MKYLQIMPGYASAHEGQNSFETANLSSFLVFSALIYLIFTNDVGIHLVPSTAFNNKEKNTWL